MGAQQSSAENGDCHPCFAFNAPFKRNVNSNDPLGSPLPDTPMSQRKKREFSSRYGGLEKEVSSVSAGKSSLHNKSQTADFYEGAVRDLVGFI